MQEDRGSRVTQRLSAFNAEWNDLPRRLILIVILIGCLFLTLWFLPYVAPFALAAVVASVIEPIVRVVTRWLGGSRIARGVVSGILVVLFAALVILILMLLIGRVFEEIKTLAVALPGWIGETSARVLAWLETLEFDWPMLEEAGLEDALRRLISDATSMLTSLATRVASLVARGAWRTAAMLPQGILFIVLTLMGTFYLSADKERIFSYLRGLLPEKARRRTGRLRAGILRAVIGQLRAGLIMLLVTFTELSIGFLLMGLDYAILLALVIALLDALPVIGAGLFLIPMALYGVVFGNMSFAVGGALIYLMTIVVRQLLEPRIIGRHLGLYPLATMMAMYAGMHAMGFLGLILGPLMLMLCKVALTIDPDAPPGPTPKKPGVKGTLHLSAEKWRQWRAKNRRG